MAGKESWIRFQQVFGYGTTRGQKVLTRLGSPGALFERPAAELAEEGILDRQELRRVRDAAASDRPGRILDFCEDYGCAVLTPEDPDYPQRLREVYSHPWVLYVMGDIRGLDELLTIAMVGTRNSTGYGEEAASAIAGELAAKGAVIVSGLARGIDTVSHLAALKAGGRTIGVQGCGIDVVYPLENQRLREMMVQYGGAVVSEFPPGEPPRPKNFPIRNRIISGLSSGTVVVEGTRRSGSLITAGHAFTQNRDVFAVPGSIFSKASQGTIYLIQQGAKAVDGAESILEEYAPLIRWVPPESPAPAPKLSPAEFEELDKTGYNEKQRPEKPRKPPRKKAPPEGEGKGRAAPVQQPLPAYLTEAQQKVFSALEDGGIHTSDEISAGSGLPAQAVLAALTQLEIFGLVKVHPGRRFSL